MKKLECKQLTIKDLEELYEKHLKATSDEKKELWKNESEDNKIMLRMLENSNCCYCKVITNKLIVDDIWEKDVDILNNGLKIYDIKEFLFKDKSTQAVDIIIRLIELGWEVVGKEDWGLDERFEFKDGKTKRYYEPRIGLVIRRKEV